MSYYDSFLYEEDEESYEEASSSEYYEESSEEESSSEESSDDEEIEDACRALRKAYSPDGLDTYAATNVNFSDPSYRNAYKGRYLASHISVVQTKLDTFWRSSSEVQNWLYDLEDNEMYVCSIGGGPGSDILGIERFLDQYGLPYSIEGTIFDYHNWESDFKGLVSDLDPSNEHISKDIHNVKYNFFQDPILKNLKRKLRYADLVTMVKFVSTVAQDKETCAANIEEIVDLMKPGAMLFFADNSGGGYHSLMEGAVDECEVHLAAESLHQVVKASTDVIERLDLNRNCCRNCNPQMATKVSAAMWQKL